MAKLKLTLGDKTVDAEKIDFKTSSEPWSSYILADGTVVRVKLIVTDIFRLPDRDPVTNLPQYVIKSSNVAAIEPPGGSKGDH